jgi:transcriptional regulator with XRE-family HTH domain
MARARPGLQIAINEILERHGANGKRLSFRQAERLTGLSPATIGELAKGNARTPETLRRFAQGLGEDAARLLLLAGFAEAAEEFARAASASIDVAADVDGGRFPDEEETNVVGGDPYLSALLARYGRALCRAPHGRIRSSLLARLQADVELLESLDLSGSAAEPDCQPDLQIDPIDREQGQHQG